MSYETDQHTATDQPQGVISLDVTIMEGAAKWRDIFDRIEARAAELNAELDHLHRRCERQFGKLLDYLHANIDDAPSELTFKYAEELGYDAAWAAIEGVGVADGDDD